MAKEKSALRKNTKTKATKITPIGDQDVYREDAAFCRYQDKLRWSRFQTAALIQAALGYVTWAEPDNFDKYSAVLLTLGGAFLILVLAVLSQKDEADYTSHLNRIKVFEENHPFKPAKAKFVPAGITGGILMPVAWYLLFALNILMISRAFLRTP